MEQRTLSWPFVLHPLQTRLSGWLDRYGLVLVVLIAGVCYALSFAPRFGGADDAVYLVTAQSLAAGQGFCRANLAGCPPETYYPPGFPLVLALFVPLLPGWPDNIPWLTLIPMAFGLLSLPVMYQFLRRQLDAFPLLLLITLAVALNYVGTWYTGLLMSETLYIFVSILALLVLDRALRLDKPLPHLFLAGILIGATVLVRSAGMALLASALLYLALKRRWQGMAVVLVATLIIVGPVLVRSYLIMQSPVWAPYRGIFINSYVDTLLQKHWQDTTLGQATLADLARRVLINIEGHATGSLPRLLFPTLLGQRLLGLLDSLQLGWTVPTFSWLTAAAAVAGFGLRLRQQLRLLDLYVLFYVGLILLPGWYTFRNLVPILAFVYLYLAWFLRFAAGAATSSVAMKWVPAHLSLTVPILVISLSLSSNLLSQVRGNFTRGAEYRAAGAPYVEARPAFAEACLWIREQTPPEALVVYRSADKMFLCSGRRAPRSLSTMPVSLNARDHASVIQAVYQEADYVALTTTDIDPPLTNGEPIDYQSTYFLNPIVEQDSEHFRLGYETALSPTIRIYQVIRQRQPDGKRSE
jgi:hypothetical protein